MITAIIVVLVVLAVVAVATAGASIRVLREYERGVVFRLGRLMDKRGPGLVLLVPSIDRMVRVSLRTVTLTVPPQEVITRDNIPARVTAVAYYRVVDPNNAVTQVENFHNATLQIAQTTLRSVLGGADLDTLLGERDRLNEALQHVIDAHTEPWGIKVTSVEIKDVEIPERMQHAIARQAEAERERRAKIINAEGEYQAATKLSQAADVISQNPVTIQLRYLQTLREIGAEQNSTVVFPLPIDLIKPMLGALEAGKGQTQAAPAPVPPSAAENGHELGPAVDAPLGHDLGPAVDAPLGHGLGPAVDAPLGHDLGPAVEAPRELDPGAPEEAKPPPVKAKRARAPRLPSE
jgi:regulator of protease activity HflC (stomatin/prohibitin superfamily)